jgi:hypothetical protein
MKPEAYLQYLQYKEFLSATAFTFRTLDCLSPEAAARIARARSVAGLHGDPDPQLLWNVSAAPPYRNLDPIAKSIQTKSLPLVDASFKAMLDNIAVGFLPTGVFNACCFGGFGEGYVIAINHGLFYSQMLLHTALIAPLVAHAQESVSPQELLKVLIAAARKPRPQSFDAMRRHYSYMTPELLGLGAAGAGFVLQFIYLHEVGHICNGDVDEGMAKAIFDPDRHIISYIKSGYAREYAADKFALRAYLSPQTDAAGAWAVFSPVEAFFLFLHEIERTRGRSSDTHPPAMHRLRRLRTAIELQWGDDKFGYTKQNGISFREMRRSSSRV